MLRRSEIATPARQLQNIIHNFIKTISYPIKRVSSKPVLNSSFVFVNFEIQRTNNESEERHDKKLKM